MFVFKKPPIPFERILITFLISCFAFEPSLCYPGLPPSLETLCLEGHFSFDKTHHAARDFGNRFRLLPSAILHPKSASDIAATIRRVREMGPGSELTVAARGSGHSLQGQAQTDRGIVVSMESLRGQGMQVSAGDSPYVDAPGGELWINIHVGTYCELKITELNVFSATISACRGWLRSFRLIHSNINL